MKNVNELRNELSDVFNKVKSGEIDIKQAAELTNLAGKMINSAKAQIDYYALRKETPVITFLQGDQEG